MIDNRILTRLESNGFRLHPNNKTIEQRSTKSNRWKKVGELNKHSIYFYSSSPHPFKDGVNTFKELLGDDYKPTPYSHLSVVKPLETTEEFTLGFDTYIDITTPRSNFGIYAQNVCKTLLNKDFTNHYDIRGIAEGGLSNAVVFPLQNYKGEIATGQIIQYNSNTGKRQKIGYSQNWLHAEKSILKALGQSDKQSTY